MLYKTYHVARTLDEAIHLLGSAGDGRARPVAGGTDLILELQRRVKKVDALVDVSAIPELQGIRLENGLAHIGAAVTYREIIESSIVQRHAFLLQEAAKRIGAAQIQNMGTLGGNMANASPAGDTIPCLYALEATVALAGPEGERQVAVRDFFRGYRKVDLMPGELIKHVSFVPLWKGAGSAFAKFGLRQSQAISVVMAAVVLWRKGEVVDRAHVALGAVAPTILRCASAERTLRGRRASHDLFVRASEAARDDISPIDDVRASAAFRRYITAPLIRQALDASWLRSA